MKRIQLSLAACRYLRPVFFDPMLQAQNNLAAKILEKQIKKKKNG